jgi:hypothetical protein
MQAACSTHQQRFASTSGRGSGPVGSAACQRRPPPLLHPSRRSIRRPRAAGQEPPIEWDVIEYIESPGSSSSQPGRVRLGLVASVRSAAAASGGSSSGGGGAAAAATLLVEPLVMGEEGAWMHDEAAGAEPQAVGLDAVLRVIEFDLESVSPPYAGYSSLVPLRCIRNLRTPSPLVHPSQHRSGKTQ